VAAAARPPQTAQRTHSNSSPRSSSGWTRNQTADSARAATQAHTRRGVSGWANRRARARAGRPARPATGARPRAGGGPPGRAAGGGGGGGGGDVGRGGGGAGGGRFRVLGVLLL